MPNDPRWRTIAKSAGSSIGLVQAVWLHLMVSASQSSPRGTYTIDHEDIASALDEEEDVISKIIRSMQEKILDNSRFLNWINTQDSVEDNDLLIYGEKNPGYYYFIGQGNVGIGAEVKIGKSTNPWARLKDLKNKELLLLASFKSDFGKPKDITDFLQPVPKKKGWYVCNEALLLLMKKSHDKMIDGIDAAVKTLKQGQQSLVSIEEIEAKPLTTIEQEGLSKNLLKIEYESEQDSRTRDLFFEDEGANLPYNLPDDSKKIDKDKTEEKNNSNISTRKKRESCTLDKYLKKCNEIGIEPIPKDHPIIEFAEIAGIDHYMLIIGWERFKEEHLTGSRKTKMYKDWPGAFANSVKDRWYRFWFVDQTGAVSWTSDGLLYRKICEERQSQSDK